MYGVITIAIGFLIYAGACKLMGYPVFKKNNNANYVKPVYSGHEGELLPNIDLLMLDSITHMNVADIPGGKPTLLFYFGPYCPYCQAEIEGIIKNIAFLKDIQIYLISSYSITEMKVFNERFQLARYSNIKIGNDYKFQFGTYFKTQIIPCNAIYSKKRRLNFVYLGFIKHDQIEEVSKD